MSDRINCILLKYNVRQSTLIHIYYDFMRFEKLKIKKI